MRQAGKAQSLALDCRLETVCRCNVWPAVRYSLLHHISSCFLIPAISDCHLFLTPFAPCIPESAPLVGCQGSEGFWIMAYETKLVSPQFSQENIKLIKIGNDLVIVVYKNAFPISGCHLDETYVMFQKCKCWRFIHKLEGLGVSANMRV